MELEMLECFDASDNKNFKKSPSFFSFPDTNKNYQSLKCKHPYSLKENVKIIQEIKNGKLDTYKDEMILLTRLQDDFTTCAPNVNESKKEKPNDFDYFKNDYFLEKIPSLKPCSRYFEPDEKIKQKVLVDCLSPCKKKFEKVSNNIYQEPLPEDFVIRNDIEMFFAINQLNTESFKKIETQKKMLFIKNLYNYENSKNLHEIKNNKNEKSKTKFIINKPKYYDKISNIKNPKFISNPDFNSEKKSSAKKFELKKENYKIFNKVLKKLNASEHEKGLLELKNRDLNNSIESYKTKIEELTSILNQKDKEMLEKKEFFKNELETIYRKDEARQNYYLDFLNKANTYKLKMKELKNKVYFKQNILYAAKNQINVLKKRWNVEKAKYLETLKDNTFIRRKCKQFLNDKEKAEAIQKELHLKYYDIQMEIEKLTYLCEKLGEEKTMLFENMKERQSECDLLECTLTITRAEKEKYKELQELYLKKLNTLTKKYEDLNKKLYEDKISMSDLKNAETIYQEKLQNEFAEKEKLMELLKEYASLIQIIEDRYIRFTDLFEKFVESVDINENDIEIIIKPKTVEKLSSEISMNINLTKLIAKKEDDEKNKLIELSKFFEETKNPKEQKNLEKSLPILPYSNTPFKINYLREEIVTSFQKQATNGVMNTEQAVNLARKLACSPSLLDVNILRESTNDHVDENSFINFVKSVAYTDDNPYELSEFFKYYDTENTGFLSKAQLRNLLCEFGEPLSKEEFEFAITNLCDNNDLVSYVAFCTRLNDIRLKAAENCEEKKIHD